MSTIPSQYEALNHAVEIAGGQSAFARICGVTQGAVWKWLQSSKRLPAEYALRVEASILHGSPLNQPMHTLSRG